MPVRYWLETLGCPKNQVDSDKLAGLLESQGCRPSSRPERADLVLVNTCAFIEQAREESIDAILALASTKRPEARLVVTGCLAERYGRELAEALPEVDQVAGFGVPVELDAAPFSAGAGRKTALPAFDLLNLPRSPAHAPWAYVKVAEGCDRRCGYCAIPSFRGRQRSRSQEDILAEVEGLGVQEVVLVAQDPVSWGRDVAGDGVGLPGLLRAVRARVPRVRVLYLHPSGLSGDLVEAIGEAGCPYFDLSLQHASGRLLRLMRRPGNASRWLAKVTSIRERWPEAALRSSFIVGYPGETEADHDALLGFLDEAQLDWAGFFAFSREEGTLAASLPDQVPTGLVAERISECSELQDGITAERRQRLIGSECRALVDAQGVARSHREAPEIDGVITVPRGLSTGEWIDLRIVEANGPDLVGVAA